jgi:hypothetical protein
MKIHKTSAFSRLCILEAEIKSRLRSDFGSYVFELSGLDNKNLYTLTLNEEELKELASYIPATIGWR